MIPLQGRRTPSVPAPLNPNRPGGARTHSQPVSQTAPKLPTMPIPPAWCVLAGPRLHGRIPRARSLHAAHGTVEDTLECTRFPLLAHRHHAVVVRRVLVLPAIGNDGPREGALVGDRGPGQCLRRNARPLPRPSDSSPWSFPGRTCPAGTCRRVRACPLERSPQAPGAIGYSRFSITPAIRLASADLNSGRAPTKALPHPVPPMQAWRETSPLTRTISETNPSIPGKGLVEIRVIIQPMVLPLKLASIESPDVGIARRPAAYASVPSLSIASSP